MGYIYKQITSGRLVVPESRKDIATHLLNVVTHDAAVVHARSAFDYYHYETPSEKRIGVDDFPNLRPSFDALFLESGDDIQYIWGADSLPEELRDRLYEMGGWSSGVVVQAADLRHPDSSPSNQILRELFVHHCGEETFENQVAWALVVYLFAADPTTAIVHGPLVNWIIAVSADGSIVRDVTGWDPVLVTIPLVGTEDEFALQRNFANAALTYLLPNLFALTAINSPLTQLAPTAGSVSAHYELIMEELKTVLDDVGRARDFGLSRALNVCRANFCDPIGQ